jgi:hypothetical protein
VCVRKGGQYVLISDGKVFKLINRDADLAENAGRTVRLTGALNGETIRVSKIERAGNATDRP